VSDDVVTCTAIKKAEGSEDIIVRLFEPTGRARSTTLRMPALGVKATVKLTAFEVKTLLVNPKTKKVVPVDILERRR
jgi:alpha-mannosidase